MIPSEPSNAPGEAPRPLAEAYRERSTRDLLELLETDLSNEEFGAAFAELYRRLEENFRQEVQRCRDSSSGT